MRAGSSGQASWTDGNGTLAQFLQPITLEKDLSFVGANNGGTPVRISSNLQTSAGCTGGVVVAYTGNAELLYDNILSPTHNGGTLVTNNARLRWALPLTADVTLTNSFGSGPLTLASGASTLFELQTSGTGRVVFANNVTVAGPNCYFYGDPMAAAITNLLTGAIYLAGRLGIGSRENVGVGPTVQNRYQGAIQLDQLQGGRREITYARGNGNGAGSWLDGNITDGSGPARNSLLLWTTVNPLPITGAGSTFAYGTVVEGDIAGLVEVQSLGSALGAGNLWLMEGGRIRLKSAANLNTSGGATATLYGNQAALSVLAVTNNFCPTFTSDSAGVLAVDISGYTAVASLASLGNQVFLGSILGG